MSKDDVTGGLPYRRAKRERKTTSAERVSEITIIALAVVTGGLLIFAVPNLITDTGPAAQAKMLIIAGGGALVSYAVNLLAVKRGAPLAAIGYVSAGIVSVASILTVGAGLFASTYAGNVYGSVTLLRFQDHAAQLIAFVGDRNRIATQASRAVPVVTATTDDLTRTILCEVVESCLSGSGKSGRGAVAIALEELAGRATAVLKALTDGEQKRKKALAKLNGLATAFQEALARPGQDAGKQRVILQKLDAEIGQTVAFLDETVPLSLLRAYAVELGGGITIQNRPLATARVNTFLRRHGDALDAVLSTLKTGDHTQPAFPKRTGVSDTFSYLGHFAPMAAIAFVVELVFPITLWLYTLASLTWRLEREDPQPPGPDRSDDGFGGLIRLPASSEAPQSPRKVLPPESRSGRRARPMPSSEER